MKKFYENPVVEITVFDVEDVITASNILSTPVTESNVTEVVNAINADIQTRDAAVKTVRTFSYKW